jgi:hypothetical protein
MPKIRSDILGPVHCQTMPSRIHEVDSCLLPAVSLMRPDQPGLVGYR